MDYAKTVLSGLAYAFLPVSIWAQQAQKPNVLVIMADDLGYGDLSCYGGNTIHTPNIDRLAHEGVRFTDTHSVAATSTPSRYSFLTGHYAWRRTDTGIARGDAGMIIRPEQYTVADLFKSAGYTTGAVGKWHLGMGDKTGGQNWNKQISPGLKDIGFDYSYVMAATGDRVPCIWMENGHAVGLDSNDPIAVSYEKPFPGEPLGKTHPELLTVMKPSPNHGHDQAIVNGISRIGYMKGGKSALWKDENINDSIVAHGLAFIEQHARDPFFLYLATNDVHVPRVPHPRFVGKSGMGPRGDAIIEFDWTVGQVMETLEKLGLRENTMIILTSDNGPVVDDGYQDRAVELLGEHRPWGPLRGGKYSNFEAGTRVPFIVNLPGLTKKGVSKALVSQVDFLSTMSGLLGISLAEVQKEDSQNQLAAWCGKEKKGRDYVIEQAGSLAISDGEWKYISPNTGAAYQKLTKTELGNAPQDQLYHLKKDMGEKTNVAEKYPEKVKAFKNMLNIERDK